MGKKTKNNYRCDSCGKEVKTQKELIKHYRDKHPTAPFGLFNAIGTTGDKFSDLLIKELHDELNRQRLNAGKVLGELTLLKGTHTALNFKYEQLVNAHNAITAIQANVANTLKSAG